MGKVKQIEIRNQTYYFYNNMINLENFESNLLKIDKKHYKRINITTTDTSQLRKLVTLKIFTV